MLEEYIVDPYPRSIFCVAQASCLSQMYLFQLERQKSRGTPKSCRYVCASCLMRVVDAQSDAHSHSHTHADTRNFHRVRGLFVLQVLKLIFTNPKAVLLGPAQASFGFCAELMGLYVSVEICKASFHAGELTSLRTVACLPRLVCSLDASPAT